MTVGEKIKELRKSKGYSQELIAEKIAVSRQTVSKWENDLSSPSTNNLINLANLLEVDMNVITDQSPLNTDKENAITKNRNKLYLLGATLCFFAFLISIGYSEKSAFFIGLGILAPMGMSYCVMQLVL